MLTNNTEHSEHVGGAMKNLLGILLLFVVGATPLLAQEFEEIPDWVIAGIAAVETGSTYQNGSLIKYRDRRDGAAGEVGPWQLAPAVLTHMGVSHLKDRIRHETMLAESMTRAWLLKCFQRTGNWWAAVAMFHTGSAGNRARGKRYAERVYAAGNADI